MVDLYSSDAVKGTVEEYLPSAAFGKCALKRHIVLVITAGLLRSSYVHAGLFLFSFFLWLWANCCFFLNLHLAASCQTDKDGDILAAVKTRISVVNDAKHGSDNLSSIGR